MPVFLRTQQQSAVPATAAGRRPGVTCRSPWRGIPAPPPSSSGSAVAGSIARREPGGDRLRRGRRHSEASGDAAAARRAGPRAGAFREASRTEGASFLPGPRGLQEELLTQQCGQPITLALSALQSRAQVRGPGDFGRELLLFFVFVFV